MKLNFLSSHRGRGFAICLGVTFLVLFIFFRTNFFDLLEYRMIDYRFEFRGDRTVNSDIVVVTIDEESIEKLGRWPWPRSTHGQLVRKLAKAGAKVVAFDSLFTEKDLGDSRSDMDLAKAAEETGIVVSAFFYKGGVRHVMGEEGTYPYEPLLENSQLGFVNLDPDRDGVTRRAYLYALEEVEKGKYDVLPSLAVAALALGQNKTLEELKPLLPVIFEAESADLLENTMMINFAYSDTKPFGYSYPFYSYADVLLDKGDLSEKFKGKTVFIGSTAAALYDLKAIPFNSKYAGVFVHANVLDNLISGNYLRNAPITLSFFYVLVVGLVLGLFLPRLSTWKKLSLFIGVTVGGILLSYILFSTQNYIFPIIPTLFASVGSYGGILFYQLVVEEREKRKIKGSFRQYLSPKIIDVITKDPALLKLGGEEKEVSIFFLDIAGFTTMSEALKPTQLVEVMNACLTEFSNIILKHDGLINKYIGDCIMAFWNAPADQPRHASQACLAALDCIKALPDINKAFLEKGLPSIDCRVGINTGTAVVGNMGSKEKFDYTVMGDPVNLASRLEGANKQYHTHVMISDVTFEKAKEEIEARDLDLIRVKGKKEPRKVFELLCRKGEMSPQLENGRRLYHDGLFHYRKRNFEEATRQFNQVFDYLPGDHLTRVYLERAESFLHSPPPPDWDGVFEMKTK